MKQIISMKTYAIIMTILFGFSFSMKGQIDNSKNTLKIDQNNTTDLGKYSLSTDKNNTKNNFTLYSSPKELEGLKPKEKSFSMNLDNGLLGPERALTPKAFTKINEGNNKEGLKAKEYFGDYKTKSEFIYLYYRDHGAIDGDLIHVMINEDIIKSNIFLVQPFKGIKIRLVDGFNKIEALALNQGEVGGNTAEFQVIDEQGNKILANSWNLLTGGKASFILVKE